MKPLTSSDKKKIVAQLNKQFGIEELPYLLLLFGKEKLRAYSGNLSKEEIINLDKNIRVENIGLYFAKWENDEVRLTVDGVQLLKKQIVGNIFDLDEKQADEWLKGNDLNVQTDRGWKVLRFKEELIGCGKSTEQRISNFMPKERRIRG